MPSTICTEVHRNVCDIHTLTIGLQRHLCLKNRLEGGNASDRAGTCRRAGLPDLHLSHVMFGVNSNQAHTASSQHWSGLRLGYQQIYVHPEDM